MIFLLIGNYEKILFWPPKCLTRIFSLKTYNSHYSSHPTPFFLHVPTTLLFIPTALSILHILTYLDIPYIGTYLFFLHLHLYVPTYLDIPYIVPISSFYTYLSTYSFHTFLYYPHVPTYLLPLYVHTSLSFLHIPFSLFDTRMDVPIMSLYYNLPNLI